MTKKSSLRQPEAFNRNSIPSIQKIITDKENTPLNTWSEEINQAISSILKEIQKLGIGINKNIIDLERLNIDPLLMSLQVLKNVLTQDPKMQNIREALESTDPQQYPSFSDNETSLYFLYNHLKNINLTF